MKEDIYTKVILGGKTSFNKMHAILPSWRFCSKAQWYFVLVLTFFSYTMTRKYENYMKSYWQNIHIILSDLEMKHAEPISFMMLLVRIEA